MVKTEDEQAREALRLKVGPGTPVRVHVTRRPMTAIQSLTESLYDAQTEARERAKHQMRQAGQQYLEDQDHVRSVAQASQAARYQSDPRGYLVPRQGQRVDARKRTGREEADEPKEARRARRKAKKQEQKKRKEAKSSRTKRVQFEAEPKDRSQRHRQQFDEGLQEAENMQPRPSHHGGEGAADTIESGQGTAPLHDQPWYPPPNKSHGTRLPRGLKQGREVQLFEHEGEQDPHDINSFFQRVSSEDDAQAELRHYKDQVHDLQDTVARLEDELKLQRYNTELQSAASNLQDTASHVRARELQRGSKHQHHHFYYPRGPRQEGDLDTSSLSSPSLSPTSEEDGSRRQRGKQGGSKKQGKAQAKKEKHIHYHYRDGGADGAGGPRGGHGSRGEGQEGEEGWRMEAGGREHAGRTGNTGRSSRGRGDVYGGGAGGARPRGGQSYMEEIENFEDANRALRRLLSPSSLPHDPVVARERDVIFKKLDLMEGENKRLREKLNRREAEKAQMERRVEHTAELQRSFEDIKKSLRDSKAKAEKKLKGKTRECLGLEEELARIRASQSYSSNALRDFQQAVSDLEAKAAGEKAAVKRAHKETKQRLRQCESVLQQVRQDLGAAQHNFELAVRDRDTETERCRALQSQLQETQRKHDSLTQQLQARDADVTSLEERLNTTMTASDQTAADLNRRLDDARAEITALTSKLETAEELAETRKGMLSEQGDIKDTALNRANEMIDNLRQQLASSQEQEQTTRDELRESKHQCDVLKRDLEASQERAAALQKDRDERSTQVSALEEVKAKLEAQVSSLRTELESSRSRASKLDGELTLERETHAAATDRLTHEAKEERDQMTARIQRLEADLQKTTEALQAAEQAKRDADRKAAADVLALREKLDYANTEKRTLKNYVSYVKSTFNSVFSEAEGEPGECD